MPFSCSKFSLFFERVDTISEGATLDCSNGVFRHYDEKTHLCLIHKKRPLLCRVAAYYDALQSTKLSREEWYWLNEEAIRRLQEEGTTKMGQRPLPYDKKNRPECTCQQKLDTKLKKSGIKNESMYKIHQLF